jgi:lipopolysaccharide/colanic/teichoic acid biosynthesis glycosyltransferase
MAYELFKEIWNQVPLFQPQRKFSHHEIYPAESFRRVMERERARTDRTGVAFSLAVFRIDSGKGDASSSIRFLADFIRSRVRLSDEVGWFDEKSVAALLPGTPVEGAWKFADKVLEAISDDIPPPPCRVFTYPATGSSRGSGPGKVEQLEIPMADEVAADTGAKASLLNDDETVDGRIESVLSPPVLPWKRMLDILGALAGLILLSPLFLFLTIFIKVVSPGPVFFKQKRVGYMGKPFTLWKFRTMKADNDTATHQQHVRNLIQGGDPMKKLDEKRDPRIIPLGRVLRRSCVDELPQLINVLRGEMSLVGPRPCLPYEAREYHLWQKRRFDTVPGMTGLWQVSGKNRTTFKEMIRLDIAYVMRRSPWLDVRIILKTIPVIFLEIADRVAKRLSIMTTAAVPRKIDSE